MIPVGTARLCGPVAASTSPHGAASDAHRARLGVDRHGLERREVDHDAVLDAAEAAAVVPTAPHCEPQVVFPCEPDRGRDVLGARTTGDQRRPPVDHRVEERAGVVVRRFARPVQAVAERRQLVARALYCRHGRAHPFLLDRRWIAFEGRNGVVPCHDRC
jgi:hypothetical protein